MNKSVAFCFAAVFVAIGSAPAFATDAAPETDAGPGNHYILPCQANCADGITGGRIGPAFTGAWYDPAESGHGLFVEILPDNRIQAPGSRSIRPEPSRRGSSVPARMPPIGRRSARSFSRPGAA